MSWARLLHFKAVPVPVCLTRQTTVSLTRPAQGGGVITTSHGAWRIIKSNTGHGSAWTTGTATPRAGWGRQHACASADPSGVRASPRPLPTAALHACAPATTRETQTLRLYVLPLVLAVAVLHIHRDSSRCLTQKSKHLSTQITTSDSQVFTLGGYR